MRNNNRNNKNEKSVRDDDDEASPAKVHVHIGSRLRRLFNEVVEEPIPDKFRQLLESLEQQEPKEPKT